MHNLHGCLVVQYDNQVLERWQVASLIHYIHKGVELKEIESTEREKLDNKSLKFIISLIIRSKGAARKKTNNEKQQQTNINKAHNHNVNSFVRHTEVETKKVK